MYQKLWFGLYVKFQCVFLFSKKGTATSINLTPTQSYSKKPSINAVQSTGIVTHNVVHPIVYQYESYHMSLIQSALCIQHHHKRGQEKPEVHEESQNFWTISNDV